VSDKKNISVDHAVDHFKLIAASAALPPAFNHESLSNFGALGE
jgi:hypothetical protein